MKDDYVRAVVDRIDDKSAKKQIGEELESHLRDKIDYYTDLGYTEEEAEKRAEEDMGDPDDTALPLRTLYPKHKHLPLLIVSVVFALGIAALGLFDRHFTYASNTYRAVYHRFGVDLVSIGIIVVCALLLILAWRRKNKWVPLTLAAGLAVAALSGCTLFRPAVFAAVKLATAGFGGYADSLFAYAYFPVGLHLPVLIGSAAVFAVLELWAILQSLAVFRQERMRGTKILRRTARVFQTVTAVFLAAEAALMGVGAAVALPQINSKYAAMRAEKEALFDLIVTCDEQTDCKQLMTDNGWQPYYIDYMGTDVEVGTYYRSQSSNTVVAMNDLLWYSQTNFDAPLPFRRDSEVLTAAQTQELKQQLYQLKGGVPHPYTLQDLRDDGMLIKAVTLSNEPTDTLSDLLPFTGSRMCRVNFFVETENGVQPLELLFVRYKQSGGMETYELMPSIVQSAVSDP